MECNQELIILPVSFLYTNISIPKAKTIFMLMESFEVSKKDIAKPVYNERSGHPIILKCSLINEIFKASEDEGLRVVVRKDQGRIFSMVTDDQGVIRNINTEEDLDGINFA